MKQPKYVPSIIERERPVIQTNRKLQEPFNIKLASENFSNNNLAENNSNLEKAEIFFTKDPVFLDQYYKLREEVYRDELGFKEYDGSENEYDRRGHILVAVSNTNKVVAGARVGFSDEMEFLSMESPETEFTYKNIAKHFEFELSEEGYSEISALVIDKNFRNNLLPKIFSNIVEASRKKRNRCIFGVSDIRYNRNYRINFRKIGIISEIIQVMAPLKATYHNMEMFPLLIKI